jgi:hypothetical protein
MKIVDLLLENINVFGVPFYHCTNKNPKDFKSGFYVSENGDYGNGVYGILDWDRIDDILTYGSQIIKGIVKLENFLILEQELALKVYGEISLKNQFDILSIDYKSLSEWQVRDIEMFSDFFDKGHYMANSIATLKDFGLTTKLNGTVFKHPDWGTTIVIQNPSLIGDIQYLDTYKYKIRTKEKQNKWKIC